MSLRDEPHYKVPSPELAALLEHQGLDRWWSVDGDPLLTVWLSFPCPADELAAELRRINRTLLIQDRRQPPLGRGQTRLARELDALVTRLGDNVESREEKQVWTNDRVFILSWEDRPDEWLLVEDEETTERFRQAAASAQAPGK
jgi:hypothetical protein